MRAHRNECRACEKAGENPGGDSVTSADQQRQQEPRRGIQGEPTGIVMSEHIVQPGKQDAEEQGVTNHLGGRGGRVVHDQKLMDAPTLASKIPD